MIPKVIHYCWFGGNALPEKDKKCIESWKRNCPDYEIMLWNELNYDVSKNKYMEQAYKEKKWGFVPDYARLDIIYEHGGVYLDTDVEIISPIDDLLENKGFAGFEGESHVALGLGFGAEKNNQLVKKLRDQYNDLSFINNDGSLNTIPSPVLSTQVLQKEGFKMDGTYQQLNGFCIYPEDYFCPMDNQTGELSITENTKSIHWYNASWVTDIRRKEKRVNRALCRRFGIKLGNKLFVVYKYLFNPKRLIKRAINKDDMYYREIAKKESMED